MLRKLRLVVLIGLVISIAACSEVQPTALFLPTCTPAPTASPTLTAMAVPEPTATNVATTAASPTPDQVVVEPTETVLPQSTEEAVLPGIGLEPWLTGFKDPVYVTFASETPPWESRLFVVEKAGRILLVENGQVQPAPFLDIRDRVGSRASEQGLLSVAFSPDFDMSGIFYVDYTDQRGDTVVARYASAGEASPQGDPTSEQKLLEIAQPAGNHNGGQLQFGPDGYLYIGTGDGGQAGDPWGNAQNPGVLLGKMLRIDVGGPDDYRIPSDNPFVAWSDVRSEVWALGLRNPWRFSFDRATGDLYIADVGQNTYEEINFQPAYGTGGENYGWDIMEGEHCFEPKRDCDTMGLIPPVAEYDHSQGCSITGGYVYRGTKFPRMRGVYLFGDFCSGKLWGLRQTPSGEWETALLLESDLAISTFGQDAGGEIYMADYKDGTIYRVTALP